MSAERFLEELAERAGAEGVLDGPWWMALQQMLTDGWTITSPRLLTIEGDAAEEFIAQERAHDWTGAGGRSNSSPPFLYLIREVQKLLSGQAYDLVDGKRGHERMAGLIIAQLAHKHGIRLPPPVELTGRILAEHGPPCTTGCDHAHCAALRWAATQT